LFQVFILIDSGSRVNVPNILSFYENLVFARVDFSSLVRSTPVERLWKEGRITKSGHYLNNISNALRNGAI
jgi:hypothetical protein